MKKIFILALMFIISSAYSNNCKQSFLYSPIDSIINMRAKAKVQAIKTILETPGYAYKLPKYFKNKISGGFIGLETIRILLLEKEINPLPDVLKIQMIEFIESNRLFSRKTLLAVLELLLKNNPSQEVQMAGVYASSKLFASHILTDLLSKDPPLVVQWAIANSIVLIISNIQKMPKKTRVSYSKVIEDVVFISLALVEKNPNNPEIQNLVAGTAGFVGGPSGVRILSTLLEKDPTPAVQIGIARAAGNIRQPAALGLDLLQRLNGDSSPELKTQIIASEAQLSVH